MNTTEIWRPVPNFEDRYEISNMGNLRSCTRQVGLGRNTLAEYRVCKSRPIRLMHYAECSKPIAHLHKMKNHVQTDEYYYVDELMMTVFPELYEYYKKLNIVVEYQGYKYNHEVPHVELHIGHMMVKVTIDKKPTVLYANKAVNTTEKLAMFDLAIAYVALNHALFYHYYMCDTHFFTYRNRTALFIEKLDHVRKHYNKQKA